VFRLSSDNDLWLPTQLIELARLRAGNKAPTFIYRFDAQTDYDVAREFASGIGFYRYPSHGIDMLHLFKTILHRPFEVNQETRNTVEMMTTTSFTNFAAAGDPNAPEFGFF
jgi:hypothetical protein